MFLLVSWLVGWFIWLSRANGKADQDGLYICQKNCPGHGMNLAGVISKSSHIQGHKGGQNLPMKIQIPVKYLRIW